MARLHSNNPRDTGFTEVKIRNQLDILDIYILTAIAMDIESNSELSKLVNSSDQTISYRAKKLEGFGLLQIVTSSQKHSYHLYKITDIGDKLLNLLTSLFNLEYKRTLS